MTAQAQPIVFVSLTGDEAIKLYDLDPQSGALELRATSPAHGPSGALFLHPSRPVLYDAHVMSTTLASFHLDTASGELTLINKVDTGIEIPAHLITDRAGRFLLTAYYEGGGVTVHRLDDDGAIGDLVQRIDTGPRGHAVLLTEDERFAFVPHVCPNNKTSQFRSTQHANSRPMTRQCWLPPRAIRPAYMLPPAQRRRVHRQRAGQHTHRPPLRPRARHPLHLPGHLDSARGLRRRREHRPRRSPSQRPVVLRIQSRPRQHRRL